MVSLDDCIGFDRLVPLVADSAFAAPRRVETMLTLSTVQSARRLEPVQVHLLKVPLEPSLPFRVRKVVLINVEGITNGCRVTRFLVRVVR
jgi:hypothetical protein